MKQLHLSWGWKERDQFVDLLLKRGWKIYPKEGGGIHMANGNRRCIVRTHRPSDEGLIILPHIAITTYFV